MFMFWLFWFGFSSGFVWNWDFIWFWCDDRLSLRQVRILKFWFRFMVRGLVWIWMFSLLHGFKIVFWFVLGLKK